MRSDYFNIHERAYQTLLREGKSSWSEAPDFSERSGFFSGVLQKYRPHTSSKVMVLGCGDGGTSLALAQLGHDVTGIDISPTAIEWANRKAERENLRVAFRQLNVVEAPVAAHSFHAVFDDHCLHCIIGEDRARALANVASSLAEGGIFVVRTHCGDPPPSADPSVLKMWDAESRCQVHDGIAGRYFGRPHDILAEILAAGFSVESSRTFKYPNQWEMLEVVAKKSERPFA